MEGVSEKGIPVTAEVILGAVKDMSMQCKIMIGVSVFIVVVALIVWAVNMTKMGRSVGNIVEPETTVAAIPRTYRKQLRNYYIKSSYNSCALGEFANDWVHVAALKNAIKHGCRLLDFEIYDIGGEPAVAVSHSVKFTTKSCYNSIPLSEVFKKVRDEAYTCSNGRDPLFLNLRVKSDNEELFPQIGSLLKNYFEDRLLGPAFSYEFGGRNLAIVPLSSLIGKVVIIGDLSNAKMKGSSLMEFINLGGNSAFNRVLQYTEVAYSPPSDLPEFAQKNLTMCVPDLTPSASNYDSAVPFNLGIQMAAMCFQTRDDNLALYNAKFDKYAFLEKTADIQHTPATVPEAPALPEALNYAAVTSTVTAGGFPVDISVG